jgi:hypothetical protein
VNTSICARVNRGAKKSEDALKWSRERKDVELDLRGQFRLASGWSRQDFALLRLFPLSAFFDGPRLAWNEMYGDAATMTGALTTAPTFHAAAV